jgi:hypothetical protein
MLAYYRLKEQIEVQVYIPCFDIHLCWNVERQAKTEPPIQLEYFRSAGAIILAL